MMGLTGIAALGVSFHFVFFLVFHAAARAVIEGKLSAIYDTTALTQLQSTLVPGGR
jgi:hypothetical protein